MHPYRSKKLPNSIGWLSLYAISQFGVAPLALAADPPPPTKTPPTTAPPKPLSTADKVPTIDAHDVMRAASTQRLLKMPLDLTVQKANVKNIAEQVEKAVEKKIAKGDPAPSIEVRGVRLISLSFAAKDSTVGALLSAAATLSNARLYSFAGYALIAPESALLPEELAATEKGLGTMWGSGNSSDMGTMAKRKALSSFIAKELGGIPKDWGPETRPSTRTNPINVSQLSPDAKAMLNELVVNLSELASKDFSNSLTLNNFSFVLSSDVQVNLTAGNSGNLYIQSSDKSKHMSWELSGTGFGFGGGGSRSASSPTSPAAPPIDLSAGKA